MAISFIGSAAATTGGNSSVDAPAHTAGDLLILIERAGGTTVPATVSGWTSIVTDPVAGGIGRAYRVSYRVDADNSISTIVGTSGTLKIVLVYRGATGIGASAVAAYDLGPNSISLPSASLNAGGASWVVGFVSTNQSGDITPTGLTERLDTAQAAAAYDSGAPVSAVSGSTSWIDGAYVSAASIELLAGGGGPVIARVWNTVSTAWRDAARIWSTVSTAWRDGVRLWAAPSGYTLPSVPPGGVVANPAPPSAATTSIPARSSYHVVHTMSAVDQRDSSPIDLVDVSISTDVDSVVWSLRATAAGGAETFNQLTSGDPPVILSVNLSGIEWAFVIDSVSRSRAHNADQVSLTGRSVTAACGTPFQPETNWTNNGATTGAQLAALSNLYTGVSVEWGVTDWIIPDQVFSFSGTPMAVVKRVAEAVGAVVTSHQTLPLLYVRPRYPTMPNAWIAGAPEVDIAFEAVVTESFERADQPEYTGAYLSGQQAGALGFVQLDGTNGGTLHPLVTDLLLTEGPAIRQRGESILGASGEQARVTLALPVLQGVGEPGVLSLGQIAQVRDPSSNWRGMVRAVSVTARHGSMSQSVTFERHTRLIEGTVVTT